MDATIAARTFDWGHVRMSGFGLANKLKRLLGFKAEAGSWSFLLKLATTVLLTAVMIAALIWYAGNSCKRFETADGSYHEAVELAGTIVHLSEVLTMSANMAAATGNSDWEYRYRQAEPQLDAAIKRLIEISSAISSDEEFAAVTDSANIELVAMENKVFDLVRQGNRQAALALLRSGEYERQKKLYKDGIMQVSAAVTEYTASQSRRHRHIAMGSILLGGTLGALAVFGWLGVVAVFREVKKRKGVAIQLDASNQQLHATEQQLRAANQQLTAGNERLSRDQQHIEQLNMELRASADQANLMAKEAMRLQ